MNTFKKLRVSNSRLFRGCAESNEMSKTWPGGDGYLHLHIARAQPLCQSLVCAYLFPDSWVDSRYDARWARSPDLMSNVISVGLRVCSALVLLGPHLDPLAPPPLAGPWMDDVELRGRRPHLSGRRFTRLARAFRGADLRSVPHRRPSVAPRGLELYGVPIIGG